MYVYHAALRLILDHLRLDATLGFGFIERDKEYWGHSLLSILSMDYEDMYVVSPEHTTVIIGLTPRKGSKPL